MRAAGVTRGALYHHFDGKDGLFTAVFEAVEAELLTRIAAHARDASAPPRRSRRCTSAWTRCSTRRSTPGSRRSC